MEFTLDNLDDEVKKELISLQKILANRADLESLLELKGDEAQWKLDMLQLVLRALDPVY
ncbi:hypothetical protein V5O48_016948 [Marasmius crinis-equi]|uniref:Uncharacterized protein n=1 Tax=Marasmius crinis-equi TaxID=585013 RepID=A0ABR3EQD4_9AGAR